MNTALARVGDVGVEVWIQPSNKLDNRLGEIEARQSGDAIALGEGESSSRFVRPSLASSSCRAASRLMVCITF